MAPRIRTARPSNANIRWQKLSTGVSGFLTLDSEHPVIWSLGKLIQSVDGARLRPMPAAPAFRLLATLNPSPAAYFLPVVCVVARDIAQDRAVEILVGPCA